MNDHFESTCGKDAEVWAKVYIDPPYTVGKPLICSACGKPTGIVHDLDMSSCCLAKIQEGK